MTKELIGGFLKKVYKFKKGQFNDSVDVFKELLDKLDIKHDS